MPTHRSCTCGDCPKCAKREYDRRRYLANKEAKLRQNRDYARANPERVRAAHRAWKQRNPDVVLAERRSPASRERSLRYYREHREAQLRRRAERHRRDPAKTYADHRRWIAENPDSWAEIRQRNKAKRRGVAFDRTAEDYIQVVLNDPCSYCGQQAEHVDHIEPVVAGGDSSWDNLTGACRRCNLSKNATPLLRFLLRA